MTTIYVADLRVVRFVAARVSDAALAPYHVTAQSCSYPSASTAPRKLTLAECPGTNIRSLLYIVSNDDDLIEEEVCCLRRCRSYRQLGDPNYLKRHMRCSTNLRDRLNKTLA